MLLKTERRGALETPARPRRIGHFPCYSASHTDPRRFREAGQARTGRHCKRERPAIRKGYRPFSRHCSSKIQGASAPGERGCGSEAIGAAKSYRPLWHTPQVDTSLGEPHPARSNAVKEPRVFPPAVRISDGPDRHALPPPRHCFTTRDRLRRVSARWSLPLSLVTDSVTVLPRLLRHRRAPAERWGRVQSVTGSGHHLRRTRLRRGISTRGGSDYTLVLSDGVPLKNRRQLGIRICRSRTSTARNRRGPEALPGAGASSRASVNVIREGLPGAGRVTS